MELAQELRSLKAELKKTPDTHPKDNNHPVVHTNVTSELACERRKREELEAELTKYKKRIDSHTNLGKEQLTASTIQLIVKRTIESKLTEILSRVPPFNNNPVTTTQIIPPKLAPSPKHAESTPQSIEQQQVDAHEGFVFPKNRRHRNTRNLRINTNLRPGSANPLFATPSNIGSAGSLTTLDRTREIDPLLLNTGTSYAATANQQRPQQRPKRQDAQQNKGTTADKQTEELPRKPTDKILLLPPPENKKISDVMETHRVRLSTFGIRNIVHFKSGAALLTVDKEKTESLKNHLPTLGLCLKEAARPWDHCFRFHQIPKLNSAADVAEDIAVLSGIPTSKIKVSLIQYKDALRPKTQMAVIEGNSHLFQFASSRPSILNGK